MDALHHLLNNILSVKLQFVAITQEQCYSSSCQAHLWSWCTLPMNNSPLVQENGLQQLYNWHFVVEIGHLGRFCGIDRPFQAQKAPKRTKVHPNRSRVCCIECHNLTSGIFGTYWWQSPLFCRWDYSQCGASRCSCNPPKLLPASLQTQSQRLASSLRCPAVVHSRSRQYWFVNSCTTSFVKIAFFPLQNKQIEPALLYFPCPMPHLRLWMFPHTN